MCLEVALGNHGLKYDYCFDPLTESEAWPLLKLHGSINWTEAKPAVYSDRFIEQFRNEIRHFGYYCPREGDPPLIVPPTWTKSNYDNRLPMVWSAAARLLGEADNIIVIGYSMPETVKFPPFFGQWLSKDWPT